MNKPRNTIQRQMIRDAVTTLGGHATAEQVYEHVVKRSPAISKATVYRNLNTLAASGEIANIGLFYGTVHFDHNTHRHYHLVCSGCARLFDVEADVCDIMERVRCPEGFSVDGCNLSFSGLCSECAAANYSGIP